MNNREASYKMRVECLMDAALIHAFFAPWRRNWSLQSEQVRVNDLVVSLPGFVVEFQLSPDAPTAPTLRWLLEKLPNGHVASETLAPLHASTGERFKAKRFDTTTEPPEDNHAQAVIEAADNYLRVLQLEHERMAFVCDTLQKTPAHDSSADGHGWFSMMKDEESGLVTVSHVEALGGNSERLICGMSQVHARQLTMGV
ncbi:hypothetical protein [Thiomonas sp. X19]|uniref:hypothetical protein n=1 Tax=Thiomonas sp. X19 TaxID=1050370 RepID=UPI0011BD6A91|nr:hypothetical protein [Thiomonas sp. X19]